MGVGAVITGADDDISRSGRDRSGGGRGRARRRRARRRLTPATGRSSSIRPRAGDIGAGVALPEVRRYDTSGGRGIVHVDPVGPPTDRRRQRPDARRHGGVRRRCPRTAPIFYAGDQSTGATARAGAARRQTSSSATPTAARSSCPQSTQQNRGVVLAANESIPTNAADINPFPNAGTDGQTVAALQGARYLMAPSAARRASVPRDRADRRLRRQPSTAWVADRYLPVFDRWIQIGFDAPRDVPYVRRRSARRLASGPSPRSTSTASATPSGGAGRGSRCTCAR